MAEDPGKEEPEEFQFDLPSRAVPQISLEEAVMLAYQYSRDNREIFGRYALVELDWSFAAAEEVNDVYEVRLSYRPVRRFQGRPGHEQFTIDKSGEVLSREIVRQPRPDPVRTSILVATVSTLGVAVVALVVMVGTGVLSRWPSFEMPGRTQLCPGAYGTES